MFINSIIINTVADFNIIINSPLVISKQYSKNDFPNMWFISLNNTNAISLNDMSHFINLFLQKKEQELEKLQITTPLIFYMWFDELASQLRFNIIPNLNKTLPFKCAIKTTSAKEVVLKKFLSSHYQGGISWEELELDSTNNTDDTIEESPYVLKVFTSPLKGYKHQKK